LGLRADRGSAPVELIAWSVILLLPMFPAIELQRAIANQVAAEAIARHSLRTAVLLEEPGRPLSAKFEQNVARVAGEIAQTYRIEPEELALTIDCSRCGSDELVRLRVSVSGREATGVMGLEPALGP
jgi:hypothetical protein